MTLAFMPVLLSLGAASPETLHIGLPAVVDARFELSIEGSDEALRRATTEVSANRAVVVVPETNAEADRMTFEVGPVEQLRISRRQGSTIIALWLRQAEGMAMPGVQLVQGSPWTVRVVMPEPAAVAVAAPAAETAKVESKEASVESSSEPAAALPHRTPERSAAFLAKAPAGPKPTTLMAALGVAMLIAFVAASWWRRRKQIAVTGPEAPSIEVLAVRGLGGKHKLALVQTCGERLLVACSDRGVRLLSHLGAGEVGVETAPVEADVSQAAGLSDIQGLVHLRQTGRAAAMVPDDGVAA